MATPKFEAVVIGASSGALDALSALLPELPPNYALPIIIVVHLPSDNKGTLISLLRNKCKIDIKEAEDKELIRTGTAYFAPPNYHLLIEQDKHLSLSVEEPVLCSRPSINVLFETAAEAYRKKLLGIILTGASSDGANGLRAVINSGGTAIIQDPDTAYTAIMPQAAIKKCPEAQILNLEQIVSYLKEISIWQ
jgi:two-component system chemotaxis response regulator CheB